MTDCGVLQSKCSLPDSHLPNLTVRICTGDQSKRAAESRLSPGAEEECSSGLSTVYSVGMHCMSLPPQMPIGSVWNLGEFHLSAPYFAKTAQRSLRSARLRETI